MDARFIFGMLSAVFGALFLMIATGEDERPLKLAAFLIPGSVFFLIGLRLMGWL